MTYKTGDRVIARGVVTVLTPNIVSVRFDGNRGTSWTFVPEDISPEPPTSERQPWDVLLEAAALLKAHKHIGEMMCLRLADDLKRAANPPPPPDPVEVLRKLLNVVCATDHLSWDWQSDARSAIAAADAAKERGE